MLEAAQIVLASVKYLVHNSAIALTNTTKHEGTFDAVSFDTNLLQAMFDECDLRLLLRGLPIERSHGFTATLLERQQQGHLGYSPVTAGFKSVNQPAVIVDKNDSVANL